MQLRRQCVKLWSPQVKKFWYFYLYIMIFIQTLLFTFSLVPTVFPRCMLLRLYFFLFEGLVEFWIVLSVVLPEHRSAFRLRGNENSFRKHDLVRVALIHAQIEELMPGKYKENSLLVLAFYGCR